jgi:transposase
MFDAHFMRELSVAEQRYQAMIAVGLSVSQVTVKVGVSRQTLHTWLAQNRCRAWTG